MSDDSAITTSQPTESNSLVQAYQDRHDSSLPESTEDDSGEGERRRPRTLADVESEVSEESLQSREKRAAWRPHVSLTDAYNGVVPDELDFLGADGLPEQLQGYDPSDLEAAMSLLDIREEDLADPRFVSQIQSKLDEWGAENTEDSEQEEADEESSNAEDDQPEAAEQQQEQQTEAPVLPKSLAELTPEQWNQLDEHVTGVWNRAQENNEPVYKEVFSQALGKAISGGEPLTAEGLKIAGELTDVLSYGGQAMLEATLPRVLPELLHNYMAQNFGPILEAYAPGLGQSFREATVDNIWSETISSEEFQDLGLPKFGTPEFKDAAKRVHEQNPWLNDFDPPGPDGQPLPVLEALRIKAAVTARLLVGERISPKNVLKQVADALAKGRAQAERGARRVSASRTLGAGRTTGSISAPPERNSIMEAFYSRETNRNLGL